jgi:hypothetical protein
MTKPRLISIIGFATAFVSCISVAGEIFDAPGPGYRQQLERVKDIAPVVRVGPPVYYVVTSALPDLDLPNPFPSSKLFEANDSTPWLSPSILLRRVLLDPLPVAFSQPIRLFNR